MIFGIDKLCGTSAFTAGKCYGNVARKKPDSPLLLAVNRADNGNKRFSGTAKIILVQENISRFKVPDLIRNADISVLRSERAHMSAAFKPYFSKKSVQRT